MTTMQTMSIESALPMSGAINPETISAMLPEEARKPDYIEALAMALNAIIPLPGLEIEICGSWVWVSGDTITHKETLKASGFHWAPRKRKWTFHPKGARSWSRGNTSMDDIRTKYGSARAAT